MDKPEIIIEGKRFRFVKRSRRGEVAIYSSGDLYARIGESEVVERMLALHKKFDEFGFPVPAIMGRGEIDFQAYYLEKSLGDKHYSEVFYEDTKKYGKISSELYEKFIDTTENFTRAQLRSAIHVSENTSFTELIQPKDLAQELPDFAPKILERYDKAISALKAFPLVLTHGDFNPHNLFPAGVIDFEKICYGPAGYDLVANIFSINYFPKSNDYEYFQRYCFTTEQEELYYRRLDALYIAAGFPKLSHYKNHFEFCRAIWATKQNFRAPKLQQWRYELFKKHYLTPQG